MFEKVRDIIVEQLGVSEDDVTMEASFIDDLGADSLDMVELIMAMEEEFNFELPEEDAEKIVTVGDAVEYIKNNVEEYLSLLALRKLSTISGLDFLVSFGGLFNFKLPVLFLNFYKRKI